ncbi:DNA-directed RNA polymerase subunit beta' [Porphyromonas somerae]|uniref:DNA-directed RNA polymerase subunit beta' n=1 Tax=Porphyromonas somerae TaxID=322095 RepID=UPI002A74A44D|nr:DNA-directed RNA polymerase subunit beta' [Porphyromonas somerae]MDY3120631.1 DNA-directed RNA polymerase subunit beta' [Porphyromonas somerae]MDY3884494.1 DNA-directed RNA polymerase subunit beta' [Porphyromonas somerae]
MAFIRDTKIKSNFNQIRIGIASPEEIFENSHGEVTKPETINYRTYKPERDGLFCERIFGPVKDYECHCGKYKRVRYKGVVCDRCQVEVTEKKVRRERMGHIKLEVPVVHIWFFRSVPNKIAYLLGIPAKKLEKIIYYESYVVVQPGPYEDLEVGDLLTEEEYLDRMASLPQENKELSDEDHNKFFAEIGAVAVEALLSRVNLDELSYNLRARAAKETSQQRKKEALKRLQVVESFRASHGYTRPEWMVMRVIPVIPPDLRPLVPLDGGRFATSDLNELYRRVIIRNNRLRRLIETRAPQVILRNEKRMLQEAVDSLFDNSGKSGAVKSDSNRPLKSLTDSLKGKQGRFRQNLLGKRVDYSARSVIVVGPSLKMHECGLPQDMAAELYKPFVIRKLIERGIVKTVKSARRIVDRREPVIWDILENVVKGHPVLLNRAPTLHRLGIQAFQPKLIEGKAIRLHPLACTAFNADFDGDQMAVHLPLSNDAILEAQFLMLASHNILNPANGTPITVPSQDMVLGLYYITKLRDGVKGEGYKFYSPEEARIAYNNGKIDIHAKIQVVVDDLDEERKPFKHMIETSYGRLLFNSKVPDEIGYINDLIGKKSLRTLIGEVIKYCGISRTSQFLDDIKDLGYYMAFKGGLSFNLSDVIIPEQKEELIQEGYDEVAEIMDDFNMGNITNNERYNQIIDVWTNVNNNLSAILMKELKEDDQGFNSIFMMMDSGARGSANQIQQLSGIRGLMAKPQRSGEGAQTMENPILSNFKEGLSVLEYFISTHGARKGLSDTALKTADAGYLTRRLVDVSQDVIITEEDCGTLRGIVRREIKEGSSVVASLYERILGRVSVHDVVHPISGELIVAAGEEIDEAKASKIQESPITEVEIRSVLTCEAKQGVCAKCYGRNLAHNHLVHKGEVVGVVAAQSIGEPGTQLTLRTFHAGGVASTDTIERLIKAKYDGILEIEELRTVDAKDEEGKPFKVVVGRQAEMHIVDPHTHMTLINENIPYGAKLFIEPGAEVKADDIIFETDPFNAVIVAEVSGKLQYEDVVEGSTFRVQSDTNIAAGHTDRIIIESKDKKLSPAMSIIGKDGEVIKTYNLPVGAHLNNQQGQKVKAGDVLVKIPRTIVKSGDITGGLPRVTELFEARNPSNPAVVAEIDGEITLGKVRRGNREVIVTSSTGEERKYLVSQTRQLLVQENDFVRAGEPLSDGAVSPTDILEILGPNAVQNYIVNGVQDVYRKQGVSINDKHFEVIVRQMMRKVEIIDAGDTKFLEQQLVDKIDVQDENNRLWGKKVITDPGESTTYFEGQIITARHLREENSLLRRNDKKVMEVRDALPATTKQVLQGITRAALQTKSFMSAASFQETPKVLNNAAIEGKIDKLEALKENVICGHLIPAGTGLREYEKIVVASKADIESQRLLETTKGPKSGVVIPD